LKRYVLH
jgi:hypothetical protein